MRFWKKREPKRYTVDARLLTKVCEDAAKVEVERQLRGQGLDVEMTPRLRIEYSEFTTEGMARGVTYPAREWHSDHRARKEWKHEDASKVSDA